MSKDETPILGYDHIELYVGNARQAAHFYDMTFGFTPVAKKGLETGSDDRVSYVMQQGEIRFVLTSALTPDHEVSRFCALHGDGVKAIALSVPDCDQAIRVAKSRGATVLQPPTRLRDGYGAVTSAEIRFAGDIIFRLVDRRLYEGPFAPGFEAIEHHERPNVGLEAIDHIVTNVHLGELGVWTRWFERVLGFENLMQATSEDALTAGTALMSKKTDSGTGKCTFPIHQPAEGGVKSEIDRYLEHNCGPGVQHIAMSTRDIFTTVEQLDQLDIDFYDVPDSYYDLMKERFGDVDVDWERLEEHHVLIGEGRDGYSLEVYSRPVQDRPTLVFELIERHESP